MKRALKLGKSAMYTHLIALCDDQNGSDKIVIDVIIDFPVLNSRNVTSTVFMCGGS